MSDFGVRVRGGLSGVVPVGVGSSWLLEGVGVGGGGLVLGVGGVRRLVGLGLSVGVVVGVAGRLVDGEGLAELFRLDGRKSVRRAVLLNPCVPVGVVVGAVGCGLDDVRVEVLGRRAAVECSVGVCEGLGLVCRSVSAFLGEGVSADGLLGLSSRVWSFRGLGLSEVRGVLCRWESLLLARGGVGVVPRVGGFDDPEVVEWLMVKACGGGVWVDWLNGAVDGGGVVPPVGCVGVPAGAVVVPAGFVALQPLVGGDVEWLSRVPLAQWWKLCADWKVPSWVVSVDAVRLLLRGPWKPFMWVQWGVLPDGVSWVDVVGEVLSGDRSVPAWLFTVEVLRRVEGAEFLRVARVAAAAWAAAWADVVGPAGGDPTYGVPWDGLSGEKREQMRGAVLGEWLVFVRSGPVFPNAVDVVDDLAELGRFLRIDVGSVLLDASPRNWKVAARVVAKAADDDVEGFCSDVAADFGEKLVSSAVQTCGSRHGAGTALLDCVLGMDCGETLATLEGRTVDFGVVRDLMLDTFDADGTAVPDVHADPASEGVWPASVVGEALRRGLVSDRLVPELCVAHPVVLAAELEVRLGDDPAKWDVALSLLEGWDGSFEDYLDGAEAIA